MKCSIDGCFKRARRSGMCGMHEARVRRHGDPHKVIPVQERKLPKGERHYNYNRDGSFATVHQRLAKVKGPAAKHRCVDCGKPATHWSYDRQCPDERIDSKIGVPYSIDLDHYQPRCVPCHKRMDLRALNGPRLRTLCPVCDNEANLQRDGSVGSHKDGTGAKCVMVGRRPAPWDERSTRVAVTNRSGGICEWCQKRRATEKHHRVSCGTGGLWTPAGIIDLCNPCHREATEHPNWAKPLGLIVKSGKDPEKVPVIREDSTVFQPTSLVTR